MPDGTTSQQDMTSRSAYAGWYQDRVRFGDLDAFGHLNNAAFATFFETGRVRLFDELGLEIDGDEWMIVIVRLAIDYRGEVDREVMLDIGLGLHRLGRSSFTLSGALFDGDRCVATAEQVIVTIGTVSRRPVPVPDELRAALTAKLGGPA
ncbi:MAG: thioesterase family protein [Alphaproteobacteria bacterium]